MPRITYPLQAEVATETIQLLQELVHLRSFNSAGYEVDMGDHVTAWLAAVGQTFTRQVVVGPRTNNVGWLPGTGDRPALVRCARLDTEPPVETPRSVDPFAVELLDSWLHGHGTADTKDSLAAMLTAVRRYAGLVDQVFWSH